MDRYANKNFVYDIIYLVLDFMIRQHITATVTLAMIAAPAAEPPAIAASGGLALVSGRLALVSGRLALVSSFTSAVFAAVY